MIHLNYKIDKPKWRNLFYENLKFGEWHWSVPKKQDLYWYQIYITDDHPLKEYTREVEQDLHRFLKLIGINERLTIDKVNFER